MAKKTPQKRDGVYERKDRKGYWISWTDAPGRRRQRKTDAQNITQAKQILSAELLRVEQAKMLGHAPPGEEAFKEVADPYLKYQKARLTAKSCEREESILRIHLSPFNSLKLSSIRKADIQRYVTERAATASANSVRRIFSAASVIRETVRLRMSKKRAEMRAIDVKQTIGMKMSQTIEQTG
jgi:hypothetical protein